MQLMQLLTAERVAIRHNDSASPLDKTGALHALAKLLIRCHEAITDQWDEDHEDTIALLDEIDETLRSLPTSGETDPA